MKTDTNNVYDNQIDQEIENAISKFSEHLMSNSKWVRLVEKLIENVDMVKKVEFKKVHKDLFGQLYLNEDITFEFDYWKNGFEGHNSLGGWLTFKEIECLVFPRVIDFDNNLEQDLKQIMKLITSIGQFDLHLNESMLKLKCYKE